MTFSVLFHSEVLADLARFLRSNQKKKKIKLPLTWLIQFIETSSVFVTKAAVKKKQDGAVRLTDFWLDAQK